MKIHTIHHFEDQPELVRWIPGALLNRFWVRFPEWIENEGSYVEHSGGWTSFELHVQEETHLIAYRLYGSVDEFSRSFGERAKPGDVALIDIMDKSGAPRGLNVYGEVVRTIGPNAAYILTAFPAEISIDVPDGHILSKPLDATALADLLIENLGVAKRA